jgi:hypothetical protein
LLGFIYAIDGESDPQIIARFWHLWKLLHQHNVDAEKQKYNDALLLNIKWPITVNHWVPLTNKQQFMHEAIQYYGYNNQPALLNLLLTIGADSLMPDALKTIDLSKLYTDVLSSPLTDVLINKCFKIHGHTIKKDQHLTAAFIQLLDAMIAVGSNTAYHIREEMITYKKA